MERIDEKTAPTLYELMVGYAKSQGTEPEFSYAVPSSVDLATAEAAASAIFDEAFGEK